MASSSDPYDGLTRALSTVGSAVIFLLGLFFAVLSFLLLKDANFQAMNDMIAADAGWAGEPALSYTLDKAAITLLVVGILAMIAACVGCCGAQLEMHNLICTYFLCVVVLAMWFLIAFVSVLNFNMILVPIAERQADQFCNVTQFYTFKAELGCTFPASRPGGTCGVDCANRVSLLREMNGCNLLHIMCHSYDWQSVGPGLCLTTAKDSASAAMPPTWQSNAPMSIATCQEVCNEHVSCSASSFNAGAQACSLAMRLPPTMQGNWTKFAADAASAVPEVQFASPVTGADGQIGYACARKDKPAIITKAGAFARLMLWLSGLTVLTSSLAICCTCSLLYTTSTRRKGKKGAGAIMHKLLCPCFIGQEKRRFGDEFDELDEEAVD